MVKTQEAIKMRIYPKELKTFKYWLHLAILAATTLGLLELLPIIMGLFGMNGVFPGGMFSIVNILISVPLLAAGDILAHTLLQMD